MLRSHRIKYILAVIVLALGFSTHAREPGTFMITQDVVEHHTDAMGEIKSIMIDGQIIKYEVVNGDAIFEGDIVLGPAEAIETLAARRPWMGVTIDRDCFLWWCHDYRWPNGKVRYTINSNLNQTMHNRINNAIQHWQQNTTIRFSQSTSSVAIVAGSQS